MIVSVEILSQIQVYRYRVRTYHTCSELQKLYKYIQIR